MSFKEYDEIVKQTRSVIASEVRPYGWSKQSPAHLFGRVVCHLTHMSFRDPTVATASSRPYGRPYGRKPTNGRNMVAMRLPRYHGGPRNDKLSFFVSAIVARYNAQLTKRRQKVSDASNSPIQIYFMIS